MVKLKPDGLLSIFRQLGVDCELNLDFRRLLLTAQPSSGSSEARNQPRDRIGLLQELYASEWVSTMLICQLVFTRGNCCRSLSCKLRELCVGDCCWAGGSRQ